MSNQILPDYKPHATLESDVSEYLENCGFFIDRLTYHEKLSPPIAEILSTRYDPTALYLRGRADRIAIHKIHPTQFEWEVKTHDNKNLHDCTLEAMPLIHHMSKAVFGVKCLYIFRNPIKNYECGFWTHKLPLIRSAWIPSNRWNDDQRRWFKSHLKTWFPEINNPVESPTRGSKDPFVVIDETTVTQLPHWTELILTELGPFLSL